MAEERLVVKIVAQDETGAGVESARSGLSGLGKAAVGLAAGGLAVAGGAAAGLAAGLVDCTREAMAAEQVQAGLAAVLAQTGGVTGVTAEMTNQLADKFSRLTMFDDESILGGQAVLARFREIGADVFPQATDAMLDLAQAMGTDVQTAATTLGKALATPGEGLLRLKAAGVVFTEQEAKNLQAMADSGRAAEAQAMILQRLQESIGTVAEAAGSTATGQWTIFNNQIANMKETVGAALLPALTQLGGALTEALNRPEVQAAIQTLAEKLGELAATVLPPLVDFLTGPAMDAFVALLNVLSGGGGGGGLSQALAAVAAFVQPVTDALGPLAQALQGLWAVLEPVLLPALQKLGEIVTTVVLPLFRDQLLTMLQTVIGAFAGFVRFLTGVVNMIVGLFSGDMDKARQGAQQVMDGILQIFNSVAGGILQAVQNGIDAVIEAFRQMGVDIATPVQAVIDAVVNTFTSLPDKLVEIGERAISGLASGIKDAAQSAVDAAVSAVDSVVGGVKDLLQMHSPSLVFQRIGEAIVAGLMQGVQRMQQPALGEMRKLAESVMDAWLLGLHGRQYRVGHQTQMITTSAYEELRKRMQGFAKEVAVMPGMSLMDVVSQIQTRLIARMTEADDPQRRKIAVALEQFKQEVVGIAAGFSNAAAQATAEMRHAMAERMLSIAGVLGSVGSAAADRYRKRVIGPLQDALKVMEHQLEALQGQEGTLTQQQSLLAQIGAAKADIAEKEQMLTALAERQADLQFLQSQAELIKLIRENGLNAQEILGGLKLGLEADLPGLIQAMTRAMQGMVEAAQRELGIASPSRVFAEMGRNVMAAFGGGVTRAAPAAAGATTGAVARVINNTYNLTANYRYESPASLAQRVRMLQMMAG